MIKNLCGKTRKVDNPYEVWKAGDWEWRVLKKYQTPEAEAKNPYARWYCAVRSPFTYGSWEYGDTYVSEVMNHAAKVRARKCTSCGHDLTPAIEHATSGLCNLCWAFSIPKEK